MGMKDTAPHRILAILSQKKLHWTRRVIAWLRVRDRLGDGVISLKTSNRGEQRKLARCGGRRLRGISKLGAEPSSPVTWLPGIMI